MFYIQLIGILAFCILVLSYYKKNTSTILSYQIVTNFLYFIHYFLLGGLSGAFTNLVNMLRNILFLKNPKNKIIDISIVLLFYSLITLLFYENIYSLLPFIGSSTFVFFMSKGNKKSLLIGAIIGSSCWLLYAICVRSYASMTTESILLISNLIQLIKLKNKR